MTARFVDGLKVAPIAYLLLSFLLFICLTLGAVFVFLVGPDVPPLKVFYNTIVRDIKAGYLYLKTLSFVRKCHFQNLSVVDLFRSVCKQNGNKVCFIFEGQEWTFKQVEEYSNQVAHYFTSVGYKKGDEVALIMSNRPEYACIWLGLAKIGVVTALVNTNLKEESLAHSVNVVDSKAILFGDDLSQAIEEAFPFLDKKESMEFYCLGKTSGISTFPAKSLEPLLQDCSKSSISNKRIVDFNDKLFYIYTSGTTGLPKAAIIRHSRFIWIASAAKYVMKLRDDDIYYNPLPMYHTAGGLILVSVILCFGGTMIIRKKFSASNFWVEAVKHKATVSQYIGEICRYLLNQPFRPEEASHSVRLMVGNGLRPHIWKDFEERFRIQHIVEMYGATEGNANVVNMFGKRGSVGFVSRIFSRLYPVTLIRVNEETGEPIRNQRGLCIRCQPGEPGEMVGKIVKNNPINSFDGYVNQAATKKKIIYDCFQKGDTAFLSGDILTMDEDGYLYFVDRTGDTFRWRGENVSTGEVENAVSKILNHSSCVVYGVQIPNVEGRAGMAAVQIDEKSTDFDDLLKKLVKTLPSYATPLFFRICRDIEATGTYKLRKVNLQKEGYDPTTISDPIYFLDPRAKKFVPLTKELHLEIIENKVRL